MISVKEEKNDGDTIVIEDRFTNSICKIKFRNGKFESCVVSFLNSLKTRNFCALDIQELKFIREVATLAYAKQMDINIAKRALTNVK